MIDQEKVEELFLQLMPMLGEYSVEESISAMLKHLAVFACWNSETMTEAVDNFRALGADGESFVRAYYPKIADHRLGVQNACDCRGCDYHGEKVMRGEKLVDIRGEVRGETEKAIRLAVLAQENERLEACVLEREKRIAYLQELADCVPEFEARVQELEALQRRPSQS
jgi:hypothetical protein